MYPAAMPIRAQVRNVATQLEDLKKCSAHRDWDIIRSVVTDQKLNKGLPLVTAAGASVNSPSKRKKLLAINFGGLGDEVLFLPTLQTIKSQSPMWHITLLTEPRGSAVRQLTPVIDDSLQFDIKKRPLRLKDCFDLLALLRKGKFDAVVSSGSSPLVAALLFLSGIPRRIGYGESLAAKFLLTDKVPLKRNQHAACMYHDLCKPLAGDAPCLRPAIEADPKALERMRKVMPGGLAAGTKGGDRLVLVHPGVSKLSQSKGVVKTWSADNWCKLILQLAQQAGVKVAVAGGPDDAEVVAAIFCALKAKDEKTAAAVQNLMGATGNIADLVALIALCDLLVCVDSAPMHLAVALNKPLVALFGHTDPAKLLWTDKRFSYLRDEKAAAQIGTGDPFKMTMPITTTKRAKRLPAFPPGEQPPPPPDVEIQPDIVFRTAMDQLNSTSVQDNSQECHR